ncbi:p53 and DNA damage-regulated protein 1 [Radiomyces spectabilis]|uniref:p53 and DNA damage-regulated protein 1 n=1 Tax=Radiomyces spectabilis TaxID=64574 RepID=UPI00221FF763|nr:p53 and DNA damage-regulated protein 1 [Radiomyces spectabilis]KAI8377725.1 p53 and DNA damage-regulated protein 1 [Radiomyces spectabilis]
MSVATQIEQLLAEREHIAEDILINKQLVIDYDRKRNSNREALRQIDKKLHNEKKLWVNFGDMFIKLPTTDTKQLIEADQIKLDEQIEASRELMKEKARQLDRLEGTKTMLGLDLQGMSAQDLYHIKKH